MSFDYLLELLILFLSAFTAATLFPVFSEAVLLSLHTQTDIPSWLLLFVASLGNVLGSCVNYVLGAYLLQYQDRKWFPMKPKSLDRCTRIYQKWGIWSLLLAWTPFIGDPLTFLAGVFKARWSLFLLMVSIGKVGRYAFLLFLV